MFAWFRVHRSFDRVALYFDGLVSILKRVFEAVPSPSLYLSIGLCLFIVCLHCMNININIVLYCIELNEEV